MERLSEASSKIAICYGRKGKTDKCLYLRQTTCAPFFPLLYFQLATSNETVGNWKDLRQSGHAGSRGKKCLVDSNFLKLMLAKYFPNICQQHSSKDSTLFAVRSSSGEEEDAEGNFVLAAPISAAALTVSLFKSISSLVLILLSGISGGHAGDGEDSEDVLHKHVEGLFGKRSL